ncbi:MAG: short-chain dehydrogenase [Planctomyces sp.]|nr:short-chain dehydrogenase [Planctomyces sp.]
MDKMKGMVAIVTGSSRGLGRAIAVEYGREGATVVACARPASPTQLPGTVDETAQEILNHGGESLAIACDVSEEAQVKAMVQQVMERYGKIDVLVNNAGIMILGESFLDIEPARWDQIMSVNLRGAYLTCRYVLPAMIDQQRGSIVNIGSFAASNPRINGTAYGTSKAALHMFSQCLANDVREHNIAVNILDPGGMKSEGSSIMPWAQHDWDSRVEPEEVGPSAVYLALRDAQSMTGELVRRAEFGQTWGV